MVYTFQEQKSHDVMNRQLSGYTIGTYCRVFIFPSILETLVTIVYLNTELVIQLLNIYI